ncbi:MFS transporter [Thiopseudomonas denitrificans]|uniref:MFS transporter n=1 Tax=Thiopseudomonas denitrificans TaxID=1501432 RepID=UPI00105EAFFD|nr:MFS transporter [Thiopseudomonas denitrificans]
MRLRSAGQWWLALLVLAAILLVPLPFRLTALLQHSLAGLIFFVAGLLTVFFSRSPFNTFKSVLVEFSVAVPQRLPKLWQTYFLVRRRALLTAMLPAVAALLGRLSGLEQTPVLLLCLTSMLLLWLYRTPRQLW